MAKQLPEDGPWLVDPRSARDKRKSFANFLVLLSVAVGVVGLMLWGSRVLAH